MHGSIGSEGLLGQALDICGLGYIDAHSQHPGTAGLQFFLSLLEGALLDISQYDLHPLLGALCSQGASYAAGCSGHNGHFVLTNLHTAPILSHKGTRFLHTTSVLSNRQRIQGAVMGSPPPES